MITSVKDLTPQIVRSVWYRRAKGEKNVDIADDLGLSVPLCSAIIIKGYGPNADIPDDIRASAMGHVKKHGNYGKKKGVSKAANGHVTNSNAIMDYYNAQVALCQAVIACDIHWREAIANGASESVLTSLRNAIYAEHSVDIEAEVASP